MAPRNGVVVPEPLQGRQRYPVDPCIVARDVDMAIIYSRAPSVCSWILALRPNFGSPVDQPGENRLDLVEHFRVPLHADYRSAWHLESLDTAVLGTCDNPKPCADLVDGLMVQAVDRNLIAVDSVQLRTAVDRGRVNTVGRVDVVADVRRNVLVECPSGVNVENLEAATDSQNRDVSFERAVEQCELELITLRVWIRGDVDCAVSCWIDVCPTRENQSVEVLDELDRIGVKSQVEGQSSCIENGARVVGKIDVDIESVQGFGESPLSRPQPCDAQEGLSVAYSCWRR